MVEGIVITCIFCPIVLVSHSMDIAVANFLLQYSIRFDAAMMAGDTCRQAGTRLCNDILFGLKLLGGQEVPRIVDATRVEIASGEGISNKLETQRRWVIWFNNSTLYPY